MAAGEMASHYPQGTLMSVGTRSRENTEGAQADRALGQTLMTASFCISSFPGLLP